MNTKPSKVKILMVCLGNICRSPLAHGILQSKLPSDKFYVDSAGTANYHVGDSPDHRSISVAKSNGIDISMQRGRQFQISDFDTFDFIFTMDHSNYQNLIKLRTFSLRPRYYRIILGKFHNLLACLTPPKMSLEY